MRKQARSNLDVIGGTIAKIVPFKLDIRREEIQSYFESRKRRGKDKYLNEKISKAWEQN